MAKILYGCIFFFSCTGIVGLGLTKTVFVCVVIIKTSCTRSVAVLSLTTLCGQATHTSCVAASNMLLCTENVCAKCSSTAAPRRVTRPVLEQVSERIVSRALFLLSLPSQASRVSLQEQSKRRWSILAKLSGVAAIARTPSQSNYLADSESFLATI